MAKNKIQKKKDREKRVAKKKLAEKATRVAQEKTTQESKKPLPERAKLMRSAVPKAENPANASKKNTFTQRRTGG
ncbi:hypothetical protein [Gimesia algae]|uniref:Uncharacterized protein n=1 Tax=Gimesia algae TaxID=2527971 RepID=A0A517VI25_9PLAN|nr:hypothetical protein [Gimesia algae]QDT92655.1 hypothetical protein Pan161_43230 [Gimesia algae]